MQYKHDRIKWCKIPSMFWDPKNLPILSTCWKNSGPPLCKSPSRPHNLARSLEKMLEKEVNR